MQDFAIHMAVAMSVVLMLVLSKTTIRYQITSSHLVVRWLGLAVRSIPLGSIRRVVAQRAHWAEKWGNTLQRTNRHLIICRRCGFFKRLVITPKQHMVFKAELERARERHLAALAQIPERSPAQPGFLRAKMTQRPSV
jgi:hypothetical protein